jgi:hypothetical protein
VTSEDRLKIEQIDNKPSDEGIGEPSERIRIDNRQATEEGSIA